MDKDIENNIKAMSAEEIKDRLTKKYFSPDAEKFARKLLKSEKYPDNKKKNVEQKTKGINWWYVWGGFILFKLILLLVNKIISKFNFPSY
jgi:hypothetical protein